MFALLQHRFDGRRRAWSWLGLAVVVLLSAGRAQSQPAGADPVDLEFFETSIRPLLARKCYSCHGPDKQFGELRADSRESLLAGGKSGPGIIPGEPDQSVVMRAVRGETLRMPLGGELREEEIEALSDWIRRGAPWAADAPPALGDKERYAEQVREHWAFQPVGRPTPPEVSAEHPIDRFLLSVLREKGLTPAPPAAREVLIRRLSYLLTGLPPSLDDVHRFAADSAPDAYERLVDRLLDSPQFGEHWARRWLDLVRYAETRGYEWNYEIVGAWRYRDYVVRAFNDDVPYDQLVREHIAGDLLEEPRINQSQNINESVIGTAFYRLGEAGHDDCVRFREIALDVVDNEIDVLSKTFQGLTVACARCHDHKLDPIPTTDYYGLYSILNSSRVTTHTIDADGAFDSQLSELRSGKDEIRRELAQIWSRESREIALQLTQPTAPQPKVMQSAEPVADEASEQTPDEVPDELPMEDPDYLLEAIRRMQAGGTSFSEAYASVADRLRSEQIVREQAKREGFEEFADFTAEIPTGWTASGLGPRLGTSSSGDFAISPTGDAALRGVYPAGLYTHTLSARLNGAVRSPLLPHGPKKLSLRVVGGMLGARRTVIDNCAIGEDYSFIEADQPQWITLDLAEKWGDLPVFVELVTRSDNPRIPDRPDRIKESQVKLLDSPESFFGVVEAVLHDGEGPPSAPLSHLEPLLSGPAPASFEALAERYQAAAVQAIERWERGAASDDDVAWISWLLDRELLSNRADASPALARLIARYREEEAELPEPRVVDGLADADSGRDFPVLISGSADSFGEPAPRRFLSGLFGDEPLTRQGSGRRELAELLADEANPLTARVMVNRVWANLFGRGIVASVDNFGSLGDRPSHPELLDYLARKFMDDGWSVKSLIRFLVTSQAFRQSGDKSATAMEADPENTLLHHFAVRRLSAEEVRDSLLSAAGELRSEVHGPSVDPYRKQPKDYRRLFAGPLLGDGRRSLYLKITRMEGPAFLETFDFPMPATTRGRRDTTTVPAQSLTLLNDPFVLEIAQHCAAHVLESEADSTSERIGELFRTVLRRSPSEAESARFASLADRLSTLHQPSGDPSTDELSLWQDLSHVLLNTKEFLYVE